MSAGDDGIEALTTDAFGVVSYVCTHTTVPPSILAKDAVDALALVATLRVSLDQRELTLIRIARASNVTWAELALTLGLSSRQAAQQRMLRLEAQVAGDGRSEVAARVRRSREDRETIWLERHASQILTASRRLAGVAFSSAEIRDSAELLADALDLPWPRSRHLMACLSLVLTDASHCGELSTIPPRHMTEVLRLVAAWNQIRPPP